MATTPELGISSAEYDSPEWQMERDQLLSKIFKEDQEAIRLILLIFDIGETWDDLIDKDKPVPDEQIHKAFWQAIIGLQGNLFFQKHQGMLIPVLATGMNSYMDSVEMEKGDFQDRVVAYGIRDFYLELVPLVIALSQGYESMRRNSKLIRRWLMDSHESFYDYIKGVTS
jgi:hypothetical protein